MVTADEHRKMRHAELHVALDELLANYLLLHDDAEPATVTLTDLAEWSRSGTIRAAELTVGAGPTQPPWDKEWSLPSWMAPW